jgi:outer membrane protein assembly factor BamB
MPLWEFNVTAAGMSLPSVGNAAWSDDGAIFYQHFAGGEVYAFKASSGEVLWTKKFSPMAGWTYLNGFLYGGILAEVGGSNIGPGIYQISALTGDFVSRYKTPNVCFEQGSTFLAPRGRVTRQNVVKTNCNNIWSNAVPSKSGEFLYFMDDLFGLMKLNANDIAAGPIWSNAFASNNERNSQQTYFSPVVSPDDRVVYASAYSTTVSIDALDGATIWTIPQENSWLTGDMVLSPYGDAIFVAFNSSVHKVDALSGIVEFATDPSHLSTFVTLNEGASMFFAAGVGVHAYESNIVGPFALGTNGANGGTSSAVQVICGAIITLLAAVMCLCM